MLRNNGNDFLKHDNSNQPTKVASDQLQGLHYLRQDGSLDDTMYGASKKSTYGSVNLVKTISARTHINPLTELPTATAKGYGDVLTITVEVEDEKETAYSGNLL